jgi:subtilisin
MKMNRPSIRSACVLLAGLGLAATSAFGQNNPQAERYIVQLKPGHAPAQVAMAHGVAARHVYTQVLNGFAASLPPGRLAAVANDPRVESIVPDQQVFAFGKPTPPPPPPATYPDVKTAPGEGIPPGVARVGARKVYETGAGVGVAVLDTGLDFNHPELLIGAGSFSSFGGTAQDDGHHGTHVGGIVAANEDGVGVVGVAPDATLYAVKVLNGEGSGNDSDIIAGLDWVTANAHLVNPRIRVINMSLGRPSSPFDGPMRAAIQSVVNLAGVTVVAAAGNDAGTEVSRTVPAGFPEVIAVASTTAAKGTSDQSLVIEADTASFFTTDGKFNTRTGIGVAISAPGEVRENISGGYLYSEGILSTAMGGGYEQMSGTSMAAPHAAGVLALLLQKEPGLTPVQVKARIMSGDKEGAAPLDCPTTTYTYDREREGVLYAPKVLNY